MIGLSTDFRRAWRGITGLQPASVSSVLVIAVGVGLTTAMVVIADPYVRRILPYPNSEELVRIKVAKDGITRGASIPTLDEWRGRSDLFTGLAAMRDSSTSTDCTIDGRVLRLEMRAVTSNFFQVLGVPGFHSPLGEADGVSSHQAIILTALGSRRVGASNALHGTQLLSCSEGQTLRPLATLPESFRFPSEGASRLDGFTLYRPEDVAGVRHWTPDGVPVAWSATQTLIGRTTAGLRVIDVPASVLSVWLPSGRALRVEVGSLADQMTRATRPLATGALVATLLLLGVSIGNFLNLQVARGLYRLSETEIRTALGASRYRLVTTALVDLGVVGLAGAAGGVVVAVLVITMARHAMPASYRTLGDPVLGLGDAGLCVFMSLVIAALGVIPTLGHIGSYEPTWKRPLIPTDGRRRRLLRLSFTAAQGAMAMILVVGGSLLVTSYLNLRRQDAGMAEDALIFDLAVPISISAERAHRDLNDILLDVRSRFGQTRVAFTDAPVVDRGLSRLSVDINGAVVSIDAKGVTPEFFEATGMTLVNGRAPTHQDEVAVSQSLALASWQGTSPLGRLIGSNRGKGTPLVIVGTVKDVFDQALDVRPTPTIYLPLVPRGPSVSLRLIVRSDEPAATIAVEVPRILFRRSPYMVVTDSGTIADRLSTSIQDRTFATVMLALYSGAAVLIVLTGIIGMISYAVTRRSKEIALRLALGATQSHAIAVVVFDTAVAVFCGGLVGTLLGRGAASALSAYAYGVTPGSAGYVLVASLLFLLVASIAAAIPARRIASIQPMTVLRRDHNS